MKKSYQEVHRLSEEFNDTKDRIESTFVPKQEEKLVGKLSNIMKALQEEEIRVKSFWEIVRERHNIFYPWQVSCLLAYSEDLKLGVEDSIEFQF